MQTILRLLLVVFSTRSTCEVLIGIQPFDCRERDSPLVAIASSKLVATSLSGILVSFIVWESLSVFLLSKATTSADFTISMRVVQRKMSSHGLLVRLM
jgi:hypothetical protein